VEAAEWDARYAERDLVWSAGPNVFVERYAADLPVGRALDVAGGEGRNALWLADRGWDATVADFSQVALDRALRIRAEGARIVVADRLHGEIDGVVDDVVVRRGDGVHAYNLAVVVDDAAQDVGEVVRGDDLLDTTPSQVWLQRALGLPTPSYAHVPLMRGPDGARLAKRHGAVTLEDLRARAQSAEKVRATLAESAGLIDPGAPSSMTDLLQHFDPARLRP